MLNNSRGANDEAAEGARNAPGATEQGEADVALLAATTADRLHSAAIHLLRSVRRHDAASGLTGPRLSALSVVDFGGPITIGALAAAEQVRAPTMTRIVAALERQGLVEREQSGKDRRATLVRATPQGERLLQEGRLRRVASLARRLAALSPGELGTLSRAADILERVSRTAGEGQG